MEKEGVKMTSSVATERKEALTQTKLSAAYTAVFSESNSLNQRSLDIKSSMFPNPCLSVFLGCK